MEPGVIEFEGHWHTLEGARACPQHCMSPETIAAIERAEAQRRVGDFGCYGDRCKLPPESGTCDIEPRCWYVWRTGPSVTGYGPQWLRFREHVARHHHGWVRHLGIGPHHPGQTRTVERGGASGTDQDQRAILDDG